MTVKPSRTGPRRAATRATALIAAALLLAACGGGSEGHTDERGVSLAHIHGMDVNPADDTLYAGSHHGVFRITGDGPPTQIAGLTRDFMGFTIVGGDHFLGSGHAGPGEHDQPANLGLIESTDAGQTWQAMSLAGEVDFHAMEAKHNRVYGWDSQTGRIMVSHDMTTWDRRGRLGLADIAVSPTDPGQILATTQGGVARGTDGGRGFTTIENSPVLYFLDWPSDDRLVGVDPQGTVHVSDDGGASWQRRGTVPGSPQAIATHGSDEIYLATETAIYHSTDNGASFTVFQRL